MATQELEFSLRELEDQLRGKPQELAREKARLQAESADRTRRNIEVAQSDFLIRYRIAREAFFEVVGVGLYKKNATIYNAVSLRNGVEAAWSEAEGQIVPLLVAQVAEWPSRLHRMEEMQQTRQEEAMALESVEEDIRTLRARREPRTRGSSPILRPPSGSSMNWPCGGILLLTIWDTFSTPCGRKG